MSNHPSSRKKLFGLGIGALGVVYGDIGTSPLYAVRECFHGPHSVEITSGNILGVLSLVFWSLTIVVSFKYLTFILRADNQGEGGIFAMLALLMTSKEPLSERVRSVVILAALCGAALLYGDGIITPSISILSAVEGLEVATKVAAPAVVPITCIIILVVFLIQRHGTARIGTIYGPVMILWFASLAILGLRMIIRHPDVLWAVNPVHAYHFFVENHLHGFVVLGSVVLVITGAEALYADMGHFGKSPIRLSWFAIVFPSLLINYFGQGALLLSHPELASNPFYGLVPKSLLYPAVGLSTLATIIASQAMISGVFSLTRQALQLGFCPRVRIVHTSGETRGQIFIPDINIMLALACIGLVLAFRESSRLAAAYGIAVTATMALTSFIYFFVVTKTWKWPLAKVLPLILLFGVFDVAYFGANLFKVLDGGWFPLVVAVVVVVIMTTWKMGRSEMAKKLEAARLPMQSLLDDIARRKPPRVPGTAVFMSSSPEGAPPVLLHHFKHNQVLHEKVVILSIQVIDIPKVPKEEKVELQELGQGFYRLIARYGFMETPHVPEIMRRSYRVGLSTDPATTSYYLGRETILISGRSQMSQWRKRLFVFMAKNAQSPTLYFGLPPGRVVELGVQINL